MRILAGLVCLFLFISAPSSVTAQETGAPAEIRNVILFIPDGFGPAQGTMARDFRRDYLQQGPSLVMDDMEVGSVRTFATDNRVTDSASSATAYATGHKTYNGAIGVDTERRPLATVLQGAKQRGMATGVVTTTRITHATPASFVAHVPQRAMEAQIAEHLLWTRPDVVIGGGLRFFRPEADGGSRTDGRDLIEEARSAGYSVALDRQTYDLAATKPFFALLADDHLAYEVDRRHTDEPSLAEMTQKALELLSAGDDGFFVMIEAGRIDHAAHGNDPVGTLHDVLAFDEALRVARQFVEADGQTLLISVADHETGGMTLGRIIDGRSHYGWYPEVLARVGSSQGRMVDAISVGDRSAGDILAEYAGVDDVTEEELAALEGARIDGRGLGSVISEIISKRAGIGWTTGGHTGVDVRLHAFGPGSDLLVGNHDNSYIGQFIARVLNLDLDSLTQEIRAELAEGALVE
jgi:alkaline phosphatase